MLSARWFRRRNFPNQPTEGDRRVIVEDRHIATQSELCVILPEIIRRPKLKNYAYVPWQVGDFLFTDKALVERIKQGFEAWIISNAEVIRDNKQALIDAHLPSLDAFSRIAAWSCLGFQVAEIFRYLWGAPALQWPGVMLPFLSLLSSIGIVFTSWIELRHPPVFFFLRDVESRPLAPLSSFLPSSSDVSLDGVLANELPEFGNSTGITEIQKPSNFSLRLILTGWRHIEDLERQEKVRLTFGGTWRLPKPDSPCSILLFKLVGFILFSIGFLFGAACLYYGPSLIPRFSWETNKKVDSCVGFGLALLGSKWLFVMGGALFSLARHKEIRAQSLADQKFCLCDFIPVQQRKTWTPFLAQRGISMNNKNYEEVLAQTIERV